jgi:tetratricopeptide (TPR) repeat protein
MKPFFTLIAIIICLCPTSSLPAQENSTPDSLKRLIIKHSKANSKQVQQLQGLASYYWRIHADSSLYYAEQSLQMSISIADEAGQGKAHFLIGNVMLDRVEGKGAREAYKRAINIFRETGDKSSLLQAYSNYASTYINEGKFAEADVWYRKSLGLAEQLKDEKAKANIYANLAICMDYRGQKRMALEYYTQALSIFDKLGESGAIAVIHANIGGIYSNLEDQHKAIEHTEKALGLYKQTSNLKSQNTALLNLAYYHKELDSLKHATEYIEAAESSEFPLNPAQKSLVSLLKGQIAEARKDYVAAIVFLDSSIVQAKYANSPINLHNGHATLARIYLAQKKYATALKHAQQALNLALQLDDAISINLDQKIMAKASEGLGNYADATKYYNDYDAGRDTLYRQEIIQAVKEVEAKYETEKKEREIARQRAQIVGQQLRLSLAFGLIVVLALLTAWLFHSRRLRQQKLQAEQLSKQLLEEQYGQLLAANSDLLEKTQDSEATNAPAKKEDAVIVLSNRDKTQVRLGDILYIKAEGNYVDIYTLQGRHTDWQMLNHYEDLLAPFELFVRTHRSFMVNRLHVVGRRATELTLSNSDKVPIASTPATKMLVNEQLDRELNML